VTLASEPAPAAASSHPGRLGAGASVWALLAAALLLFLFFGEASERTLFWNAFFDAGHVPLFGLLSLAALRLMRARFPTLAPSRAWWTSFGLMLVTGVATELLQVFQSNRDASVGDLARDAAGAGAFLLGAAVFPRVAGGSSWAVTPRARRIAVAVSALLLLVSGFELAHAVAILAARRASLPTLYALDGSWWERHLVRPGASTLTPHARPRQLPEGFVEPLARLDLKPALYPGVSLDEPYPDWRAYHRLAFTVVSDLDAPLKLTIRVHDAAHDQRYADRFNRTLTIAPGVNRIVIPLDDIRTAPDRREMDLSRIRGIVIFGYQLATPARVFLGPLRLE
jgi:hypothetical protein